MINRLFRNKLIFSVFFFTILFFDIIVKLNTDDIAFRFFSKGIVMLSLIVFYIANQKEKTRKRYFLMLSAMICFLAGDFFLIVYYVKAFFIIGLILFVLGKILYALRFSNKQDFNLLRLMPFLLGCFVYMIILMKLIINNLGDFFFPTLIYLFASMIVAQFAFLRKGEVNYKSYFLVIVGILFGIVCDSLGVLQSFYYADIPFHKIMIMLFYGVSQFFIVTGILIEREKI